MSMVNMQARSFGRRFLGGAGALVLALALLAAVVGPAAAQILINEICADPASDWDGSGAYSFRDDEWVEIVNAGASTVVIDGYRLAGADTSWRYEFAGELGPGEVAVVYGSESYAWEDANGEDRYGLRLGNTTGEIWLWRLSAPDTVRLDGYVYADHEAEDDRSTGRLPDGGPEWRLFDALNLYGGEDPPFGTGCSPSPGERTTCPTAVERTTWSRIKQFQR
jgi:hypothetical protein